MNRAKRKFTVAVATLGCVSLFMAFIGVPMIAMFFVPTSGMSGDGTMDEFLQAHVEFADTANVANIASIFCLLVAAACFVYVVAVLAIMFIGPKETVGNQHTHSLK